MAFELAWFLVLLLGAMIYVFFPLILGDPELMRRQDDGDVDLRQRHLAALRKLSDLEFEYRTDKILWSDYRDQNATLEQNAALLQRRLDDSMDSADHA